MLEKNALRRRKGQSLVEVLVGSFVLIPIALFGIDLSAVVLANTANDSLAKSAARAAANQGNQRDALAAARQCVLNFQTSPVIVDVRMDGDMTYDERNLVVVKTIMTVKMPVAVAGMETIKFEAQAVEPVVAAPADV